MFAVKRFRPYLLGTNFTVFSDHNPLQSIASLMDPHGRLARWLMFLQNFHFEVKYRPGKQNGNADALTQCAAVRQPSTDPDFNKLLLNQPVNSESEYYRMQRDFTLECGPL